MNAFDLVFALPVFAACAAIIYGGVRFLVTGEDMFQGGGQVWPFHNNNQ